MFQAIFGRRTNDVSQPSPIQLQRQRQIASIRSCCPNIVVVEADKEFRIPFVAEGNSFNLEIHLPSSFPHECPVLKVTPAATHPMLDDQYHVTGVPALTAFSMHTDLGRIIQGILMEFQNHPPKLSTAARTLPPLLTSSGFGEPSATLNSCSIPFKSSMSPCQFPQLLKLSNSQLEELLKEDGKLQEFVDQLPEVLRSEEIRHLMVTQNEDLARKTLELKPTTEQRKHLLLQKVDEVNVLKEEFEQNSQVLEAQMQAYQPSTLQNNLRVATRAAEEEADTIAQQFLDGKLSTNQFLAKFMEVRTLGHVRRVKEEQLHAQLQELNRYSF
ncbi:vacuolar protein sorting-associated protein 37A isoform X1 [Rhipicephalus microplus]|uniref:Putative vacuolar protein sorting 37 log a n=2 Tax=Rhipicephalus microplus TaxID=6941 RepID=A0A6M2CLT6_RHIMP|nr:vacuolar protein sorting-associated protein 37A-like [Rhipicephalus microplus]